MKIIDGIGYSSKAIIRSESNPLELGVKEKVAGKTKEDTESLAPWALWGTDNLLPVQMADHIENCGVLSAALDAKARIAAGKGIQPFLLKNVGNDGKEELEWVNDAEIQEWLEQNSVFDLGLDFSYDRSGYGWRTGSLMLNRKMDKIERVFRKDVYECRLQKKDEKGIIKNLILCGDWPNYNNGFDDKNHIQIPALLEGFELQDLTMRAESKSLANLEFAFIDRRLRNGRQYYPLPLWYAARKWVEVARAIPSQKTAMFKNQITLKYLVTISEKYWNKRYPGFSTMDKAQKEQIVNDTYQNIDDCLSGNDNAYKSIFASTTFDPISGKEVHDIQIENIDDKVKDGKMLPESAAANSEILFALMINPSLMGAGAPGGPYANNAGGSNVRENYLIQMMIMEEERKMNSSYMNIVKNFNGWTKKFPNDRLVFRYQSSLLTTLDTGKSTKAENL